MELADFAPRSLVKHDVPTKPFNLVPIGDLHVGSEGFAQKAFQEFLKWVDGEFEHPQYLGMGDYTDFMSPSNRASMRAAKVYDSSRAQIDIAARELTQQTFRLLEKTRGQWIGMLSGHHLWEFQDGGTSDISLAQQLDARHLKSCAGIQICFKREDTNAQRGHVGIWAHHGEGGGKYPIPKLIRDVVPYWPQADIWLMGHFHENEHKYIPRLKWMGQEIVSSNGVVACTGGWLQGYVPGETTYVERGMLSPRSIGGMVIQIRPTIREGNFRPKFQVIDRG